MKEKIIVSVLTALITTGVLWLIGVVGNSTISLIIPSKAIVAFDSDDCPDGWEAYKQARGRYVVGIVKNGNVGAVVGTKLDNEENRPTGQHLHQYDDAFVGGSGSGIQSGDSYPRTSQKKSTIEFNGKPGTNAPYVQLLYCIKS